MHGGTLLLISVIAVLGVVARVDAGADSSDLPTAQLLSRANVLLSQGQGAEALALYDSVLERDPSDYATAYRKGVAALALGQTRAATESFERVLKLSEYDKARLQLGKIHLKQGDFEAGERQISAYLKGQRGDKEAAVIQKQLKEGKAHLAAARKMRKAGRWEQCVGESTAGMQASPNSLEFRRLRSDCHIGGSNVEEASADLIRAAQLAPHSPEIALRLATISTLFLAYPADQALAPIRQCLHSDPESKPCKKAFRLLKALNKDLAKAQNFIEAGSYRSAVNVLDPPNKPGEGLVARVREAIAVAQKPDPSLGEAILPASAGLEKQSQLLTKLLAHACKAHTHLNQHRLGRRACAELAERDPENIDGLVGKGEALMADESWEEAVRVLTKAFENGGRSDREVLSRLQRAQKGLKVSKQKDYYKVLGVPRDADDRTLKKAYRKATLRAHPDKGGSEEKMAALNEAYEVLSNPELRQRYDNGDDPNDPSHQGHGFQQGEQVFQQFFQGGMPFHGGGFQGGGGQTFSFRWG